MRYFSIEFLDDARTPGFMEVDDTGNVLRLCDTAGSTITDMPHQSYSTTDTKPAAAPDWASTNGEKIAAKESFKAQYIAAVKDGSITADDIVAWDAEAAIP